MTSTYRCRSSATAAVAVPGRARLRPGRAGPVGVEHLADLWLALDLRDPAEQVLREARKNSQRAARRACNVLASCV